MSLFAFPTPRQDGFEPSVLVHQLSEAHVNHAVLGLVWLRQKRREHWRQRYARSGAPVRHWAVVASLTPRVALKMSCLASDMAGVGQRLL